MNRLKARRVALRHLLAAAMTAASLSSPMVALAQSYPTKPIQLIVPFTPGGVTDTSARIVADKLGQRLGQQVIVVNKPGASGNIGTQLAATAPPDGYTLLLGFDGTLVINPHVFAKVPFDPIKDLTPVSKIGDVALILVANPSLPVKSFADLLAYSKTQPGGLPYGSAGTGSTPHLAGELLKQRTGVNIAHVPYKGGGQAMGDAMGGTLPLLYTAVAGAYPFVSNGKLKAIAVASATRLSSLPDVPTFGEAGVPGFEVNSWVGILAPAATPKPIVERLQQEIHAVVQSPDVKEQLDRLGITSSGNTPAEFGAQIRDDLRRYAEITKVANIKVD